MIGANTANVYLNNLFLPPTNSVTVNSGVTINNSGSGNTIAVAGSNYMWTVINDAGSINGKKIGVGLAAGGVVDNRTDGVIAGGDYGVGFAHNQASVINNGLIIGTNKSGVVMEYGGIVDNQSGTIQGNYYGVEMDNFPGSVTNAGTITGFNKDGVYLAAGGSVNNLSGGNILGDNNGVHIETTNGVVANAGMISGGTHGVLLKAGGTVDNQLGGTILGSDAGVRIEGGLGSVTNRGHDHRHQQQWCSPACRRQRGKPVQRNHSGRQLWRAYRRRRRVRVQSRHDQRHQQGRRLHGFRRHRGQPVSRGTFREAIMACVSPGNIPVTTTLFEDGGGYTVYNSGSITGTNGDGVLLENNGTVYNSWHGTIVGGQYGVEITNAIVEEEIGALGKSYGGGSYTVYNSGTITGLTNDGVRLWNGGSVYNSWHGTIEANGYGVDVENAAGSVVNYGKIISTNKNGVYLGAGGSVDNWCRGTITGQLGVEI